MRRFAVFALTALLLVIGQQSLAFWQSRDSNYNHNVTAATSSVIKHIEAGSCTIGAAATSCTYTLAASYAVVTANTMLVWNGLTSSDTAPSDNKDSFRIAVTNTTTITATRGVSVTPTVTANFTVVEFASGVNSIQAGTITIAAGSGSTGTASVTTTGANPFVIYQGCSEPTGVGNAASSCSVAYSGSTVTATVLASATVTQIVGYMVVDLDTTIVTSAQPKAVSIATSNTSDTDTLGSAVVLNNALLMWGGTSSQGSSTFTNDSYTTFLTNTTTVTKTRNGTGATARTINYTAIEIASSALNSAVQRGSIAIASGTSNTATISSVTTSKAFVNWNGFLGVGNPNVNFTSLVLTNATTVTAAVNTAGTPTTNYEVAEFK